MALDIVPLFQIVYKRPGLIGDRSVYICAESHERAISYFNKNVPTEPGTVVRVVQLIDQECHVVPVDSHA